MPNETTIDPYTVLADGVKQVIDTEFAAEGITAIHDRLHESLGTDAITVGISPAAEYTAMGNATANVFAIEIRFYDFWDKQIDPEQLVDPRRITMFANRLKRALQQSAARTGAPDSPEVWFFNWVRTDYPDDPTGNKTRFHMRIEAMGDNTALIETR